jgi:hypothetical protein
LHKYDYAGGDPVNMVDPTGHEALVNYGQLLRTLVVASAATAVYVQMTHTMAPGALQGLGITINCGYDWISTKFSSVVNLALQYGNNGEVIQVGPCTWSFTGSKTVPAPPIAVPIDTTDPNWPQKRFDRCRDLEKGVQDAKNLVGAMGGGCKPGMTASELAVRAAAWAAEIMARKALTAECYPDPNTGHQTALSQAEDALNNCQEIPPVL